MHVGIAKPRWRGKRSRYSRHMHNPQYHVSSKRSIMDITKICTWHPTWRPTSARPSVTITVTTIHITVYHSFTWIIYIKHETNMILEVSKPLDLLLLAGSPSHNYNITVTSHHGVSNHRQLDCSFNSIKIPHKWLLVKAIHQWLVDYPK